MQLTANTVEDADGNSCLRSGDQVLGLISVLQCQLPGVKHAEGQCAAPSASISGDNQTLVTSDTLDGLDVYASAQEVQFRNHGSAIGRNHSFASLGSGPCPDMIAHIRQQLLSLSDSMSGSSLFMQTASSEGLAVVHE